MIMIMIMIMTMMMILLLLIIGPPPEPPGLGPGTRGLVQGRLPLPLAEGPRPGGFDKSAERHAVGRTSHAYRLRCITAHSTCVIDLAMTSCFMYRIIGIIQSHSILATSKSYERKPIQLWRRLGDGSQATKGCMQRNMQRHANGVLRIVQEYSMGRG